MVFVTAMLHVTWESCALGIVCVENIINDVNASHFVNKFSQVLRQNFVIYRGRLP